MNDIVKMVGSVHDQESLARLLEVLSDQVKATSPELSASDFIATMAAWVEDMDGYYQNTGKAYKENSVSWGVIAEILVAASVYE